MTSPCYHGNHPAYPLPLEIHQIGLFFTNFPGKNLHHVDPDVKYLISSKAASCVREYGSGYYVISCQESAVAMGDFEIQEPQDSRMRSSLQALRGEGIVAHFGHWHIPGYPGGVWFDLAATRWNFAVWQDDFWRVSKIRVNPGEDAPDQYEMVAYGYLLSRFFAEYLNRARPDDSVVLAHFHEWQTAVALIWVRRLNLRMATVFSLQSTLLGRRLCNSHPDFRACIRNYVPLAEAEHARIPNLHRVERLAAKLCHVLTAVSSLVSTEAEYLFGRKPDLLVPLGVRASSVPRHQFELMHQANKRKICDFLSGHFYGTREAAVSLDDTLLFATAGVTDHHGRGYDLFLEALCRLNAQLRKEDRGELSVVALILVPLPHSAVNVPSLHGQAISKGLKKTISEIERDVGRRIFEAAMKGEVIPRDQLITEADRVKLKGQILAARKRDAPPIVTHNVLDGQHDPILQQLRYLNLLNGPSDVVKVVVVPDTEEVFDLDLVETLRGCNVAFFPSLYESWGHLQLLATNAGIPVVTTNLCGYGSFLERYFPEYTGGQGAHVLDRLHKGEEEIIRDLVQVMSDMTHKSPRERVLDRSRAEKLGHGFGWPRLYKRLHEARLRALAKAFPDEFERDDDLSFV